MDYKVIWTDPAIDDLHQIVAALAPVNPDHARGTGHAILDHAEVLASFPWLGPVYEADAAHPVRVIFTGSHHVFYRVLESPRIVEIMHVRHTARRPPRFGTGTIQ